jgi:hypothetical protein
MNASLDECRLINDDLAKVQVQYPGKFVGLAKAPVLDSIRRLPLKQGSIDAILGRTAMGLLKL